MAKTTWIDEQTAADLIGLTVDALIRAANTKEIPVRIARATRKARPRFVREDIETHLAQSIKA